MVALAAAPDTLLEEVDITHWSSSVPLREVLGQFTVAPGDQELWFLYEEPWWTHRTNSTRNDIEVHSDSPIREIHSIEISPTSDSADLSWTVSALNIKLNNKFESYWLRLNRGSQSAVANVSDDILPDLFVRAVSTQLDQILPPPSHEHVSYIRVPDPFAYLIHKKNGQLFQQRTVHWSAGLDKSTLLEHWKGPHTSPNMTVLGHWYMPDPEGHIVSDFRSVTENLVINALI